MPITFLSEPHLGFIRTTYLGLIGLPDLAQYVYSLTERGWLTRPQLIDARNAALAMSPRDVRTFSELMLTLGARHGRGPIAFVPGNDVNACVASLYQDYGAGSNPQFATFDEPAEAERWLTGLTGEDARPRDVGEASSAPQATPALTPWRGASGSSWRPAAATIADPVIPAVPIQMRTTPDG